MKIVYIECNAEEMKANRTFIDALVDIANGIVDGLDFVPVSDEDDEEEGYADDNR